MGVRAVPTINKRYEKFINSNYLFKNSVMTGQTSSALYSSTTHDILPLIIFSKDNTNEYRNPYFELVDRDITPDEIMEVQGIKITTPIRTIYDCIMDGNIEVYYETYHDMVGEYVTAEEVKAYFEKKGKMDIYEAAMEEINLPCEI